MCPLFLDYKFALSQCGQQNHYASFFAKLKGTEVRNLLDNSTIVLLEAYFNELLYQSGDYCYLTNIDRNKNGSHPHSYELYLSSSENKA